MIKKSTIFIISLVFIVTLYGCRTPGSVPAKQVPASIKSFGDYNAVLIQNFSIPSNVSASNVVGTQFAEKVTYHINRYSQKFNLFDIVIKEEGKKIPKGKKVLVIKGEIREYTLPSIGKRIGRNFIPGGEWTGTAAVSAHYKFIEKSTGKLIYETDLRTTSTGNADTVDYAIERNAEAAAKLVYKHSVKK